MGEFARITRRSFHRAAVTAAVGFMVGPHRASARTRSGDFTPKYALASSMYRYKTLEAIVPEVHKIGASSIDLWPKPHGNPRPCAGRDVGLPDRHGTSPMLARPERHGRGRSERTERSVHDGSDRQGPGNDQSSSRPPSIDPATPSGSPGTTPPCSALPRHQSIHQEETPGRTQKPLTKRSCSPRVVCLPQEDPFKRPRERGGRWSNRIEFWVSCTSSRTQLND